MKRRLSHLDPLDWLHIFYECVFPSQPHPALAPDVPHVQRRLSAQVGPKFKTLHSYKPGSDESSGKYCDHIIVRSRWIYIHYLHYINLLVIPVKRRQVRKQVLCSSTVGWVKGQTT